MRNLHLNTQLYKTFKGTSTSFRK